MFFNQMQGSIKSILEKIHAHPFNQELSKGSLPKEKFLFYLVQDALYLADFSRALALTAARLPSSLHTQQFIQFALDAVKAERELHFGYINHYQPSVTKTLHLTNEQSPTCFMYTNYLLKMASLASVEEAVSSLLPCFFVYNEVGKKMLADNKQPANPYDDWIRLYSGESFELSVHAAITIVNELAEDTTATGKEKMQAAFVRATQLEWLFWESAYIKEQWVLRENV